MASFLIPRRTDVPFVGGLSTKVDPYQIPFNQLAAAKDVVFSTPGEVRTRYGYKALPKKSRARPFGGASSTEGAITAGQALMTYGKELVLCDPFSLYSWDPGQGAWVWKDTCQSINVTTANVSQSPTAHQAPDENVAPNGTRVDVWETPGGANYSVTNIATGQVIVPATVLHAKASKPKVLQLDGVFCILYVRSDTTAIYLTTLPAADPFRSLGGAVTHQITGGSGNPPQQLNATNPNYDATIANTTTGNVLYVAFCNSVASTGAGITVFGFLPRNLATQEYTYTFDGTLPTALTIFADSPSALNGPAILYTDGARVYLCGLQWTLADVTIPRTILETRANVGTLTGVSVANDTTRALDLYWTVNDTDSSNTLTIKSRATGDTPTIVTPGQLRRSVGLAGKAFTQSALNEVRSFVPVAHQSVYPAAPGYNGLQNTFFVCDWTAYIAARFFYGTAGGLPPTTGLGPDALSPYGVPLLPEVSVDTGGVFRCAFTNADSISTFATTTPAPGTTTPLTGVYTQAGVVSVAFEFFNSQNSYLRAELGRTLLIGGGLLQSYDGQNVVENGFNLTPENITLVQGTGGNMADGTYWYTFVYQWTNAQGEIEQSGPSIPIPITITAGSGTASVTATIPTLRLTAKRGVVIVPYRSQNTGTVFYQAVTTTAPAAFATNAPTFNSTTSDTVTFTDEIADSVLAANAQLYTTGNVIENLPTPPCSDLTVDYNRLFALDSTDHNRIWFSQQVLPGEPVEMSEWLFVNVDPRGGPVTAIRALDQHLVVFKESLIMAIDGIGPDATGGQGNFQEAYIVTTDVGCTFPRSIGLGPDGLYFQSAKGIYLLDRSLAVRPIGLDANGLVEGLEVTSTQLLSYTQQMRFTLTDGTLVGHDYLVNQWFEHTNVNAVDAAIWQDTYCYLRNDGTVMQETVPGPAATIPQAMASFSDAGKYVGLSVTTPWLNMAGLNGWARTWWVFILGKVFSNCTLRIEFSYDYDPTVRQTVYINVGPSPAYGVRQPYGSGPYGGPAPDVCFRVQPNQQLSAAMQLTLTVTQMKGAIGEGMALSGLTLEWGESRTPRRPNSSATY